MLLGLPVLGNDQRCDHCSGPRAPSDPFGLHYASCRPLHTPRHDRIRDIIAHFLRRRLPPGSVVLECDLDASAQPSIADTRRPVDVGYFSVASQEWTFLDVVVSGDAPPSCWASIRRGDPLPSSVLAAHARDAKRRAQCATRTTGVLPLAFGAFGGTDPATRRALLAVHAAGAEMSTAHDPPGSLLARLQLSIWRQLACAVYRRRCGRDPTDARPSRVPTWRREVWRSRQINHPSPVEPHTPRPRATLPCTPTPQRRPRSLPPSSRTPHDPHTTRRPPPTIHAPITTRHSHVLAICESLALMGAALSIDQSFYDAHPRHSWICNTMYSAEQHCRNNALASFESVAAEVATCLLRATDALRARLQTDTAFPISAPIRTLILSGPDQTSHDALQCNNLLASRPRTTRLLAEWVDCMASANAPAPAVSWLTSLSPAWADESSSEATHSSTASSRSTSCSTRSLNPRDSRAGPAGASVLSRARNPLPISSTCGTSQSGSESDCGVL
jgi:hypothetical protein